VSGTHRLKLTAADGKNDLTDNWIVMEFFIGKTISQTNGAMKFLDWFLYTPITALTVKSKKKANTAQFEK
jgi:hypothetical protein